MKRLKEQLSALDEENGKLKAQIQAIKQAAVELAIEEWPADKPPAICRICKYADRDVHHADCFHCAGPNNYKNWQPPEVNDA